MRIITRLAYAAAGILLCLTLSGCGGASVVKGKLTNGGTPVTVGDKGVIVMSFSPAGKTGTGFGAEVKPDGTFVANGPEKQGVPPGKYRIAVQQFDPYPTTDKLDGKFAPGKTTIVREVNGGTLDIDLAKP